MLKEPLLPTLARFFRTYEYQLHFFLRNLFIFIIYKIYNICIIHILRRIQCEPFSSNHKKKADCPYLVQLIIPSMYIETDRHLALNAPFPLT